jgi:hypothetical protein
LRTPACRIVEGRALALAPISRGMDFPIAGRSHASLLVSLGEPQMLHASRDVPNVSMVLLPKPPALASAFLALPAWLLASRIYGALMRLQFTLLRRLLLRRRPTRVELFARAYDGATGTVSTRELCAEDGMWTAGVAAAAIASLLYDRPLEPGVRCVDECLSLRSVLERMRRIDANCVDVRTEPNLTEDAESGGVYAGRE